MGKGHAIILAGGKGTRLKPYTTCLPKPLMPIGDLPIIEVVLKQVRAAGINSVTIAVGHLAQLIEAFVGNGEAYGLKVDYSREETPMGTAGPIGLLRDCLQDVEYFVALNGDVLTTMNLRKAIEFHLAQRAAATICVNRREVPLDFGVIEIGKDGRLDGYREKPVLNYSLSMGINIFSPSVLKWIPDNQFFNIPDLMLTLRDAGEPVYCYQPESYWLDIGRVDDYATACDIFERRRMEFLPSE